MIPHPARDLGGSRARHAQFEQQELGVQLGGQLHRFCATRCLPHDSDIRRFFQDGADTCTGGRVIVGQQHADGLVRFTHFLPFCQKRASAGQAALHTRAISGVLVH